MAAVAAAAEEESAADEEGIGAAAVVEGWEKLSICSWPVGSPSCSTEGGMQTSLSLVQAEQGQMLVVAESHLILRLRQPLQALITV